MSSRVTASSCIFAKYTQRGTREADDPVFQNILEIDKYVTGEKCLASAETDFFCPLDKETFRGVILF